MVDQVLSEELPASGPLALKEALAWTAVAEYAVAMDVPITFPGLSPAAIDAWRSEPAAVTAPSIIRLLLALDATGNLRVGGLLGTGTPELASIVERLLVDTPVDQTDSLVLFGGTLAVHAATGREVHTPGLLAAEREARLGECLGDVGEFVRLVRAPGTTCDVEATRYAALATGSVR